MSENSDNRKKMSAFQAAQTLNLVLGKDPDHGHARKLHDGYLSALVEAIMAERLPELPDFRKMCGLDIPLPKPVILTIDYGHTFGDICNFAENRRNFFSELLERGNYDRIDREVLEEGFTATGSYEGVQKFETGYIVFPRRVLARKVYEEISRLNGSELSPRPWLPATPEQLLAFGIECPEVQREFCVTAFNSKTNVFSRNSRPSTLLKVSCVFALGSKGPKRTAEAMEFDEYLPPHCLHLIVRKCQ